MQAGSAGELGRRHGLEQIGFWRKILEHPSYDAFWQEQAMDRVLAAQPLKVPTMLVHSLWDQEDIYGAIAVYKAIEPKDTTNDKVFLVIGPWHHGQEIDDGSSLGAIQFDSDTALTFRRDILRPFLDHYLKDGAPKADVAPVTAFETGTNTWRRLPRGRPGCDARLQRAAHAALSAAGLGLELRLRRPRATRHSTNTSPTRRSRCRSARVPTQPTGYDNGLTWPEWLVDDQREASGRPDVLAFVSERADGAGEDQRPAGRQPRRVDERDRRRLGGEADRRLPRRSRGSAGARRIPADGVGDIFRGRYRESLETPKAIAADKPLPYKFALPTANHVFLPRPPDHGAGAVQLVPAVRPQPADVCAEYLLGQARGLSQGDAAHLPRARQGELRRAPGRGDALSNRGVSSSNG